MPHAKTRASRDLRIRDNAADSPAVTIVGPSSGGGRIVGGQRRKIGPGDVFIVPPNAPHWFSEITTDEPPAEIRGL
jgi:hypothetical protein